MEQPVITYPYSIGELKLQTKNIQYSRIYPGESPEETIRIKNEVQTPLRILPSKVDHLTVTVTPDTLQPEETGEITILFHTDKIKKMGRISTFLPLRIENAEKKNRE